MDYGKDLTSVRPSKNNSEFNGKFKTGDHGVSYTTKNRLLCDARDQISPASTADFGPALAMPNALRHLQTPYAILILYHPRWPV